MSIVKSEVNPVDPIDQPAQAAGKSKAKDGKRARRRPSAKLVVGSTIVAVMVLFAIFGPLLVGSPTAINDIGLSAPSAKYWLGTTSQGQDIFAQLAHASRGSLIIGVLVGLIAVVLSSIFGILSAYVGGVVDDVMSLFTNVMLIIPGLPLMIVIGSYMPNKGILLVSAVLGLTSWAASARVLRAQTLSLRGRDYVLASKVSSEKTWRIIAIEILPNLLPVLSSQFVFAIIFAVLGEAGLSFLGLGSSSTLTWGLMLNRAQNGQALLLGGWWWFVPPGLCIALLGMGLSLINFSIDEVINPKLRVSRRQKVVELQGASNE